MDYVRQSKEQIEIEAALAPSGETGGILGLPEELLSIIMNTDFLNDTEDSEAEIVRRRVLEGFLMAWSLIFQHFVDSVRNCVQSD